MILLLQKSDSYLIIHKRHILLACYLKKKRWDCDLALKIFHFVEVCGDICTLLFHKILSLNNCMANLVLPNQPSFPLPIMAILGAKTCMLLFCCNLSRNYMVFKNDRLPSVRSIDTHLDILRLALVQSLEPASYLFHQSFIAVDILRQYGTAE